MIFQLAKCLGAPHGTKPWCLPEAPMPETCVSTRRRRFAEMGQVI